MYYDIPLRKISLVFAPFAAICLPREALLKVKAQYG
jgi:hypothetical protein